MNIVGNLEHLAVWLCTHGEIENHESIIFCLKRLAHYFSTTKGVIAEADQIANIEHCLQKRSVAMEHQLAYIILL